MNQIPSTVNTIAFDQSAESITIIIINLVIDNNNIIIVVTIEITRFTSDNLNAIQMASIPAIAIAQRLAI